MAIWRLLTDQAGDFGTTSRHFETEREARAWFRKEYNFDRLPVGAACYVDSGKTYSPDEEISAGRRAQVS
jgi:hypothetical protein